MEVGKRVKSILGQSERIKSIGLQMAEEDYPPKPKAVGYLEYDHEGITLKRHFEAADIPQLLGTITIFAGRL